jgi:hypothetical protein
MCILSSVELLNELQTYTKFFKLCLFLFLKSLLLSLTGVSSKFKGKNVDVLVYTGLTYNVADTRAMMQAVLSMQE